jgi:hypothetical protein
MITHTKASIAIGTSSVIPPTKIKHTNNTGNARSSKRQEKVFAIS